MTEVPSASPSAACYLEELHLVLHSSDGDSAFIPDAAAWYIAIGRLIEEHIAHQHLIPPARYMVATQRDHERRSTVGHGQAYKHHDCTGGTGRPSVQDRDRPLCACQLSGRHPGERKSPSERRSCRQRRSPSSVGHMVSNVEATGLDLSIPKRLGHGEHRASSSKSRCRTPFAVELEFGQTATGGNGHIASQGDEAALPHDFDHAEKERPQRSSPAKTHKSDLEMFGNALSYPAGL